LRPGHFATGRGGREGDGVRKGERREVGRMKRGKGSEREKLAP